MNYEITNRREGDIEKIWANVNKAQKELGWKANYSIEDAMLHAWLWEKRIRKIG